MALNGRDGQRFSQAPHPMHRSVSTTGILGEFSSLASDCTIVMAPTGQWRAQLPHSTPSVRGRQFSLIHTACPICMADLSAAVIGSIAPAGQTSEHRVHSGLQYPRSYDDSGCMSEVMSVDGLSTPFGQTETHNWHAVQCDVRFLILFAPGGTILVLRAGIFLSAMAASPPSMIFSWAWVAATVAIVAETARKLRRELSVCCCV